MMQENQIIKKAYKKLKSSVYYDKTLLTLRDKIVEFESNDIESVDRLLDEIYLSLSNPNENDWIELSEGILQNISISAFPKKIANSESNMISNINSKNVSVNEIQYFIDMNVEGHIISTIWLMIIGYKLDDLIYEHSYGNRIRKRMREEFSKESSFTPYLFEPYFEQYESWRDLALKKAMDCLQNAQDTLIITMDIKRYFYSVDFNQKNYNDVLTKIDLDEDPLTIRVARFVYDVIEKYSSFFSEQIMGRKILPIGFLPSNILANIYLMRFDKAILDGLNPIYYGRYVDDILIVEKIEKNSELFDFIQNSDLKNEDFFDFYFTQDSRWKGLNKNSYLTNDISLLKKIEIDATHDSVGYEVRDEYHMSKEDKSSLIIQSTKLKVFYFRYNETDALLQCFRTVIQKNKSEFRFMPEDESVFQSDDYSEIYNLKNSDTLNKLRGVEGVTIDKFSFSKYLGKLLRIGGLISDQKELKFECDLLKIFDSHTIIENYSTWEKVIEILVVNEKFDLLENFTAKILVSITNIKLTEKQKTSCELGVDVREVLQKSLLCNLKSSLSRATSLVWGKEISSFILKIPMYLVFENSINNFAMELFNFDYFTKLRENYCKTRMVDKYIMPILIDSILCDEKLFHIKNTVNLSKITDILKFVEKKDKLCVSEYVYYPYLINVFDLSMHFQLERMLQNERIIESYENFNSIMYQYIKMNYMPLDDCETIENSSFYKEVTSQVKVKNLGDKDIAIKVGNNSIKTIRVSIANAGVDELNFRKVIINNPNRTAKRYKEISYIINQSIREKANILVMPEAFVPYEWLPLVARTCAKNQIALITGIEHMKVDNRVYNNTAIILPFTENGYKSALISFHLKNHYSPKEIEDINSYRLVPVVGKGYELYCWNDFWFPVYCCYELASISDRAKFQSYADLLIAVEWNKDINYYSNILESLSRDIHCYCIQVNSSDYGDSRITKPSKTEEKDVIRTKGGRNYTILVDDLNIEALRDFQLLEHSRQKDSNLFKMTPPLFNKEITFKKITKVLWNEIEDGFGKKNKDGQER